MLKILYIHNGYPGISETFVRNEMHQLASQGAEVELLSLNYKRSKRSDAIPVHHNTLNPFSWLTSRFKHKVRTFKKAGVLNTLKFSYFNWSSAYLANKVISRQPDLIISHFLFGSTFCAAVLSEAVGIPHHVRLHTSYSTLSLEQKEFVLANAHTVSAISRQIADLYATVYNKNIEHIPQDIGLKSLRSREHTKVENSTIIAIGRMVPKKGFANLLHAMAHLKEQQINVKLQIVGDGPLRSSLLKLHNSFNLGGYVEFLGALQHNETLEKLSAAQLLVVPSVEMEDQEGIPTVISEAMALKTLVLTTSVGAVEELLVSGKNGIILSKDNPMYLAKQIKYCMKLDKELMLKQATEDVSAYYNRVLQTKDLIKDHD